MVPEVTCLSTDESVGGGTADVTIVVVVDCVEIVAALGQLAVTVSVMVTVSLAQLNWVALAPFVTVIVLIIGGGAVPLSPIV